MIQNLEPGERLTVKARTILGFIALAALLGTSATVLNAQGIDVFLQGGRSSFFDKNYPSTTAGPLGTMYSPGGQFSAGAEARLGSILGIEGAYGWGQNNLEITQLSTSPQIETGYGIRHQRASGDLILHVPFVVIKPYLAGGIEYDRFSPYGFLHVSLPGLTTTVTTGGGSLLSSDNKLGFNYGGGVEFKLLPLVGLRLDVRDHVTSSPSFGLPGRYNATAHDLEYSGGIVLHLGL
jgi:opacity protein-like surface antigen